MKKLLAFPIVFALFFATTVFAAPLYIYQKTIIPEIDSTYTLGTTSKAWLNVYTDELCLNGDCKTAWPTGGSGGTDILFNWNSATNIISTDGASTTATTSLSTNGFTANNATITNATSTTGWFSSVVRALNSVFTSATTTNLRTTQLGVGSDYITDLTGTGLSIVGNALTATNDHVAVTVSGARDYITLSGQDIVRGVVDVSDDTNLSGDTEVVLTGDALSLGESLTFTSATATNLASTLSTTSVFYGAGLSDCDTAGSSKLLYDATTGKFSCGTDQNSGGSGASDWNQSLGTYLTPSTTVGIRVAASSTIGDGTRSTMLTISGNASTTRVFQVGTTSNSAINSPVAGFGNIISVCDSCGTLGGNLMAIGAYTTVGGDSGAPGINAFGARGSSASPTATQLDDSLYFMGGRGFGSTVWNSGSRALINMKAAQNFTDAANGTYIAFVVTPNNSITRGEQMRLDQSGFLGIGSTSPSSRLTVAGDAIFANTWATGTASSTYASTSALTVHNTIGLFGSSPVASNNALCIQLTGDAGLCDGNDASGGGGGGSISTSSIPVAGNLTYWTSPATVSDVATGTLTETVTGLELSATRGLVGGSAVLSLTNGFTVPTTSSTTEWGTFYQTPSTRITAGNHIDWTSNTLDVVTTGDWTGTLDGFEGATLAQTNWSYDGTRLTPTSSSAGILANGSSTLSLFNFTSATGTNATTTNLFASLGRFTTSSSTYASSTSLTTSALRILGLSDGCVNVTSGVISSTGSACGSGGGGAFSTSTVEYVIYKSGSNIVAIDGNTGSTISTNTDLAPVLLAVFANATSTTGRVGGHIKLRAGNYTTTGTTTVYGSGSVLGGVWVIEGSGASTTNITVNGGTFLHFTNWAEVVVRNLSVDVSTNENAFTAAGLTTGVRSVWNSTFENIHVLSSAVNHTGFPFNFGNDFRNTFENIELSYVGNGFRSYTQGAAFNNGDSVFTRWFCEINSAINGSCFEMDGTAGARINQSTFIDVNGIADGSGSHTFIKLINTNHMTFLGVNAELFATTSDIISGRNNRIEYEYVTPRATGGTYFGFGSAAYNNSVGCRYLDNPAVATTFIRDASTLTSQHNIVEGIGGANCVMQGSGSFSYATSTATVIRDIYDNVNGSGTYSNMKMSGDRLSLNFTGGNSAFLSSRSNGISAFTTSLERTTLTSGGLFGIGSTTPGHLLTVQGGNSFFGGNTWATGTASSTYATTSSLTVHNNAYLNTFTAVSGTTTNIASTLSTTSVFYGAGLTDCDTGASSKLLWDVTTGKFSCGTDQTGGGGGSSNWILNAGADALTPSSTKGIVVNASSSIFSLTTQSATTTNLTVNSERFTDLTGFGLANSGNALGIDTTGAADGECLTYSSTGPAISWASCGGAGGSKWTDGTNFTYLTNTTYDLALGSNATATAPFWWDVSATTSYIGNGGAGDSVITFGPTGTEWTMGFDDTDDSFSIATGTSLGLNYFTRAFSTTTILSSTNGSFHLDYDSDSGVRMNFGGGDYDGSANLDQFTFHGRIKNDDWFNWDCPYAMSFTQITSDTRTAAGIGGSCDGFEFDEDGTAYMDSLGGNPGWMATQLGSITATDGAGFWVSGLSTGWLQFGTSTPSYEVTARIGAIVANSSTTSYYIGYSNEVINGGTYETEPTRGCYFVASTTQANWRAVCKSPSATTNTDTGVSSTTINAGNGEWRTFRIDADDNEARFYIKQPSGGFVLVANPSDQSVPTTTSMNAGIWFGRTTGTQAIQFQFMGVDFWWRKFVPN